MPAAALCLDGRGCRRQRERVGRRVASTSAPTRGRRAASITRGRRPRAGSRRAGCAARPASGRRSTRRARSPRARPGPPRAAPAPARRRSRDASTASSTSAIARSCSTWKKPGPGRELEHVGAAAGMDPRRAGLQRRDQRRVAREHADLADLAGHDHHLGLALVRRAVRRDEREVELLAGARHARSYAAASALPRSTAPSIGPTM